jgi:hypothetical protein
MKPSYTRRIRRKAAASKDTAAFRKEGQKENTFFGETSPGAFFQPAPVVQRKCADCEKEEKQVKRLPEKKEEEEKKVQRLGEKKEEEDKKVSRKEGTTTGAQATTGAFISSLGSKGSALPAPAQQFFGARMGYDFGQVKVHTGAEAAQSAKDINAQAYTYKNHIVFNEGKYDTHSAQGKKLLAHELTHVIQQDNQTTDAGIDRQVNITAPYPVTPDFEPGAQFRAQSRALGLTESLLNGAVQLPSQGPGPFERALVKPTLDERDLSKIPRPNLNDGSLNAVRANLQELKFGSFGKAVQLVQEALIAWGQGLDEPVAMLPKFGADKDYKGETKSAVEFFQEQHPGLKRDGIVGDITLGVLQDEMNKLNGGIYSIQQVGINNFTGLIHIPPASNAWPAFVTPTNSFFNNSIDATAQAVLASHFRQCNVQRVTLTFNETGGVVASILTHEQVHEKDQLQTIRDHLVPWDTDLSIAQLLNMKFRAANLTEANQKLYPFLGIPSPLVLSATIIREFRDANVAFHRSAAGQGSAKQLSLPDCNNVVFTLSP